jgi:hypothetical protein
MHLQGSIHPGPSEHNWSERYSPPGTNYTLRASVAAVAGKLGIRRLDRVSLMYLDEYSRRRDLPEVC